LVDHKSTRPPAASPDEGIGLLLTQICRAHRNLVASSLDEIKVHVGQDHVLYRLAIDEGITQAQLAGTLGVDASTVTKTLARLERDGLVERRADSSDARALRVYLTAQGRGLVEPVIDIWTRAERRLVRNMSEAERLLLHRLLAEVLANLAQ
jgi:DNA-binding MarR family transcriptional regulator